MRVLLISHTCQSQQQGQPKAARMGRIPGVELRVLVPNRWREYDSWRTPQPPLDESYQYQVGKVNLPWSGPGQWYLHWYPELAETLREFKPDIIDIWEEPWGMVSAHATWLRNRLLPGTKIISETEQNIAKILPPPFESFRSYTLRHADFLIGRSGEAVEHMRAKGYTGPAAVVPNAVDTKLFQPMDRELCRRILGLSGFVAGYVGRFVEEKGLMEMVEALPHCPEDVHALFVGKGPYKAVLEQRIQELGLRDRVRILPERTLEKLPHVMNAIDALVLPSRTTPRWKEQFGRVIIEAQACGTPVIGSDSGAIPEVVGDGGLVFEEQQPGALAAAIMELYCDPQRAREKGRIGRHQTQENYTWARVADRMGSIYTEVLSLDPKKAERFPAECRAA